jgi:PAS domain S-box-containing protein
MRPPRLRDAAEKQLAESPASEVHVLPDTELLHELQVHQIELERQNEELRQAQVELEKSRDRFVDFYESAPVGYLTLTDKGLIADINLTGTALLGAERTKILQHRFSSFVIPADADRYHSHFFGVLKTAEKLTCELGLLRGDGTHINVRLDSLRLIKDGQTPALRVVLTDITGRKQLEFELANRERHFAALIATTPVGVFETDADGKCVFVNERWQQIAGMSLDAAKGDGWTNAIHPEDRPLVCAEWAASTVERRPFRLEYRFQNTNSDVTWVLGQSSRFLSATGELAGYVGTITDITERRQIQESLHEHWARFKVMFDESPFGIALIDSLTGHIYAVNSMFAKIAGRTLEEMTTINWMSITHPDDIQGDLDSMELMNTGKTTGFQMNKRYIRPDGTFVWISMTIAPIYVKDKANPLHLCMIEDITERKKMEDELRHSQAMLKRTEGFAHIGSWEWDVATDTVTWSDELFRIFHRDPAEKPPSFAEHSELYCPEDMQRLKVAVDSAVRHGTPYELELRAIRKDGETRVCMARGYAEMGPAGPATTLFGSLQDITERKQAEEDIRKSEERLTRAELASKSGHWELHLDSKTIVASVGAAAIYGLTKNSFDLTAIQSMALPECRPMLDAAMTNLMEGDAPYDVEFKIRSMDDGEIKDIRSRAIIDRGRRVLFGIVQDITEKKKTELGKR